MHFTAFHTSHQRGVHLQRARGGAGDDDELNTRPRRAFGTWRRGVQQGWRMGRSRYVLHGGRFLINVISLAYVIIPEKRDLRQTTKVAHQLSDGNCVRLLGTSSYRHEPPGSIPESARRTRFVGPAVTSNRMRIRSQGWPNHRLLKTRAWAPDSAPVEPNRARLLLYTFGAYRSLTNAQGFRLRSVVRS